MTRDCYLIDYMRQGWEDRRAPADQQRPSANLCGNGGGRKRCALIHDPGRHDRHAAWIDALVTLPRGGEGLGVRRRGGRAAVARQGRGEAEGSAPREGRPAALECGNLRQPAATCSNLRQSA
jgi:hypothetical protein